MYQWPQLTFVYVHRINLVLKSKCCVFGLTDNDPHWLFALASLTTNTTVGMPDHGQHVFDVRKTYISNRDPALSNDTLSSQVQ